MGLGRTTRSGAFLCALALAATGCGGGSGEPREPRVIPAALAASLAETSDDIAARLEAGDGCGAAALAADLRARAEVAAEDGTVPASLAEPLLDAVARLDDDVVCKPPAEEGDEDDDAGETGGPGRGDDGPGKSDDRGEEEDKGPGDDRGRGDDGDGR